jgi:hypothetical protein
MAGCRTCVMGDFLLRHGAIQVVNPEGKGNLGRFWADHNPKALTRLKLSGISLATARYLNCHTPFYLKAPLAIQFCIFRVLVQKK